MIKEENLKRLVEDWLPKVKDPDLRKRLMPQERGAVHHPGNVKVRPTIEIKLIKDKLAAEVKFPYFDPAYSASAGEHPEFIKFVLGPADMVYRSALKIASRTGIGFERNFNREWNRTLLAVVNRPSEGKSMLNLGTYQPKEKFGLYDLKTPAQLLSQKLIRSKIPGATFAARAGVDEASLYRHLSGTAISREAAVKYAKVLGCDPAELLFNPLLVPIWGRVDTQEMKSINKLSVYAGEIRPNTKDNYALCPREIYRPDVKCLVIDQPNSVYHNNHFFYYHSTEKQDLENQLVVVGTPIKNFNDKEVRYRYFVGIYRASALGKGVFNIVSIDPHIDYGTPGSIGDEDPTEYAAYLVDLLENNYVIDNVKPTESTFVAPIVSIVNPTRIAKSELRSEIIKDHEKFYGQARMSDQMNVLRYKELLQKELSKAKNKAEAEHQKKVEAEQTKTTQEIGRDLRNLIQKFEQQRDMANKQAMETRSRGGNKIYDYVYNRFYNDRDLQKQTKYQEELKEVIMEQQKAVEKLKEAVSVPELFEEGKRHDDEDKVA